MDKKSRSGLNRAKFLTLLTKLKNLDMSLYTKRLSRVNFMSLAFNLT
jgi:hypothetical protein